jgi:hypothetical protein
MSDLIPLGGRAFSLRIMSTGLSPWKIGGRSSTGLYQDSAMALLDARCAAFVASMTLVNRETGSSEIRT